MDRWRDTRLHWIERPSEDQLLGVRRSASRRHASPPRERRSERAPVAESAPPRRGRQLRSGVRDLVTLTAVGVATCFAVLSAGTQLPSRRTPPVAPVQALGGSDVVGLDRRELTSLVRRPPAEEVRREASSRQGGGSQRGGAPPGARDEPEPPPPAETTPPVEETDPPLAEVTIPGVGRVTVEQPQLPLPDDEPTLPATDDLLLETGLPSLP